MRNKRKMKTKTEDENSIQGSSFKCWFILGKIAFHMSPGQTPTKDWYELDILWSDFDLSVSPKETILNMKGRKQESRA